MFDIEKHKVNLTNLLVRFYKDSNIATSLGFKGGTACYFFYDLPRFSVDLDFDLINLSKIQHVDIEKLKLSIEETILKDYEILDSSDKHNTLFWLVSYEKGGRHIKVEISTRDYPNSYEYRNFYGTTINVLKIGDIIAHKLVAIQDRKSTANRDIFDTQYFLSSKYFDEVNYEIVKFRTGLDKKEFLSQLLDFIEKYKPKSVLDGLGELVTNQQKDWIRSGAMIEDLKTNLKILIGTAISN
ncbi:MAG: nucleotidyl transferase AbiEii/AbiGii toxin family protein [bacterium]|nr:nucleotidyl transferase AbiEii/AbiGii toxin family protein [bacterium]